MNFYTFRNEDGTVRSYVNLDAVSFARPDKDGKVNLFTPGSSPITVDLRQFEEAMSKKDDGAKELTSVISRLIQAMDRMTVHFPTSIRMHM